VNLLITPVDSVRLSNAREKLENVLDGEFHGDHSAWVAPLDQFLDGLVLLNELLLHRPPDHLDNAVLRSV
jgi:hypothetical protein